MPAGSAAFVVDSLLLVTCHKTALNSAAGRSRFLSYLHGRAEHACLLANGDDALIKELILNLISEESSGASLFFSQYFQSGFCPRCWNAPHDPKA